MLIHHLRLYHKYQDHPGNRYEGAYRGLQYPCIPYDHVLAQSLHNNKCNSRDRHCQAKDNNIDTQLDQKTGLPAHTYNTVYGEIRYMLPDFYDTDADRAHNYHDTKNQKYRDDII